MRRIERPVLLSLAAALAFGVLLAAVLGWVLKGAGA
jgi:hypothetical protein